MAETYNKARTQRTCARLRRMIRRRLCNTQRGRGGAAANMHALCARGGHAPAHARQWQRGKHR